MPLTNVSRILLACSVPSGAGCSLDLDAGWNGHPLDRTRVSHLAGLGLSPAA